MITANVACQISRLKSYDLYGKEVLKPVQKTKCAVVKLIFSNLPTSVRADSSASRGFAEEIQSDARLLFNETADIQINDKVEIAGGMLRVITRHIRYNVSGQIDHIQVDLKTWE